MRGFKIQSNFQRAVLREMVKSCIYRVERDNLKMIFDALDDEKDGEISIANFSK